jgi:hypothetical protein
MAINGQLANEKQCESESVVNQLAKLVMAAAMAVMACNATMKLVWRLMASKLWRRGEKRNMKVSVISSQLLYNIQLAFMAAGVSANAALWLRIGEENERNLAIITQRLFTWLKAESGYLLIE